jgi:hypothetical protein
MAYLADPSTITYKEDPQDYFSSIPLRHNAYRDFSDLSKELLSTRQFLPDSGQQAILVFDGYDIPFSLDIHGFTRKPAEVAMKSFIQTARKHGLPLIRIIHGNGEVLSEMVDENVDTMGLDSRYDTGFVDIRLSPDSPQTWPTLREYKNVQRRLSSTYTVRQSPPPIPTQAPQSTWRVNWSSDDSPPPTCRPSSLFRINSEQLIHERQGISPPILESPKTSTAWAIWLALLCVSALLFWLLKFR